MFQIEPRLFPGLDAESFNQDGICSKNHYAMGHGAMIKQLPWPKWLHPYSTLEYSFTLKCITENRGQCFTSLMARIEFHCQQCAWIFFR